LNVFVLAVGRPGPLFRDAIDEYEQRAARYWSFHAIEVKEEKASRGVPQQRIRDLEAARLLEKAPTGLELVALTRTGVAWDSAGFARYLQELANTGRAGAAFLIGGAFGLGEQAISSAARQLSLSACTLPHELARLVLTEQIYRAGTIARGEPYHKARS
jgi:23S rRNA (pseudouridine1915-N3)-methyltransferase